MGLLAICLLGAASVAAILMAMIKFVPLFPLAAELTAGIQMEAVTVHHYLTALFRFDVDLMTSDITMRSLYLPSIALCLVPFTRRVSGITLLALALITFYVLLLSEGLPTREILIHLPGMGVADLAFPIIGS